MGSRRRGGARGFALDGAIDGVDQRLGLDEFDPRPLGLVAVERCRQGFGESIAVIGHPLTRLFQRLQSLAHLILLSVWSYDGPGMGKYRSVEVAAARFGPE